MCVLVRDIADMEKSTRPRTPALVSAKKSSPCCAWLSLLSKTDLSFGAPRKALMHCQKTGVLALSRGTLTPLDCLTRASMKAATKARHLEPREETAWGLGIGRDKAGAISDTESQNHHPDHTKAVSPSGDLNCIKLKDCLEFPFTSFRLCVFGGLLHTMHVCLATGLGSSAVPPECHVCFPCSPLPSEITTRHRGVPCVSKKNMLQVTGSVVRALWAS